MRECDIKPPIWQRQSGGAVVHYNMGGEHWEEVFEPAFLKFCLTKTHICDINYTLPSKPIVCLHRLGDQDAALSRLKPGFESLWRHWSNSCLKSERGQEFFIPLTPVTGFAGLTGSNQILARQMGQRLFGWLPSLSCANVHGLACASWRQ